MKFDFEALAHKALIVIARDLGQKAGELIEKGRDFLDEAEKYADGAKGLDPQDIMICAKCRVYHPPRTPCGSTFCADCLGFHLPDQHTRGEATEP